MKAVILAGGAGTRLRPLTETRPKPMVPVANRPLLEHTVRLLRRHGFRELVMTLHYHPWVIQEHFGDGSRWGVSIAYSVEREALGTAGGVRRAADLLGGALGETVLVISGDALTDIDLTGLVAYHRSRGAAFTMALGRVADASQFGVASLAPDGRLVRFAEKPGRGEAFSDLVNTGIYVMESRVLGLVPAGEAWDFSRQLIPALLARGEAVFGWPAAGYWCDVGTPERYLQANFDALAGQVALEMPGGLLGAGIRVGADADIHPGALLQGPLLVGEGAVIGAGARVGGYALIGPGCTIGAGAVVRRAVVWAGAYVGAGAKVRGLVAFGGSVPASAGLHEQVPVQAGAR